MESLKKEILEHIEMLELIKETPDLEIQELLSNDVDSIRVRLESLEIMVLLDGKYDSLGAILEIHSGAGGTEACDWANMLYRMYTRWCEKHGFHIEEINNEAGDEAGIKSVMAFITGKNAFGYLKCERGVHRLVRISPFDSNSRRHTSFASVEVTPLFDGNDVDVEIIESDIKIDVYRSSGAGGQHVNTTDSAVRMTHIPTGIVVTCQNERSQIKNREKALQMLRAKVYEEEVRKKEEQEGLERRTKIGTGDRSEKIRTYNYPQNRVTDHRIGFTLKQLDRVMEGNLEEIITALINADQEKKLKEAL